MKISVQKLKSTMPAIGSFIKENKIPGSLVGGAVSGLSGFGIASLIGSHKRKGLLDDFKEFNTQENATIINKLRTMGSESAASSYEDGHRAGQLELITRLREMNLSSPSTASK